MQTALRHTFSGQAHGVLMVVAWIFILPISVAVARTCKGFRTPLWFHLHRALGVRPGSADCTLLWPCPSLLLHFHMS